MRMNSTNRPHLLKQICLINTDFYIKVIQSHLGSIIQYFVLQFHCQLPPSYSRVSPKYKVIYLGDQR